MAHNRRQRGLTLVELLVVLVILAFAAGVVIVSAPPERPAAKDAAFGFAAALRAASDAALFEARSYRARTGEGEIEIERYDGEGWQAVSSFRQSGLARGVTLEVEATDASLLNAEGLGEPRQGGDKGPAYAAIDPVGVSGALTARFSGDGKTWIVTLDEGGVIAVSQE